MKVGILTLLIAFIACFHQCGDKARAFRHVKGQLYFHGQKVFIFPDLNTSTEREKTSILLSQTQLERQTGEVFTALPYMFPG